MQKTLAEIAKMIGGKVDGDGTLTITGVSTLEEAKEGHITFVSNAKYLPLARHTKASAIITTLDISIPGKPLIRSDNPSLAFGKIVALIAQNNSLKISGIHKQAVIAKNAVLGKNVSVGACAIIENDVQIGDNTVIYAGSYIGQHTKIGQNCSIYPNVTIREYTKIGNSVTIHSGSVIGSDGFGYELNDGMHQKIPQIGIVQIEDDVEIGSNVTIDRARLDKTFIGRGTKIDNLVQIGHNVHIGENCIIISQVGISGSVKIGQGSILAGQVGVAGHLTIGENCVIAAQAGVSKSLPDNSKVMGYPARPMMEAQRVNAATHRLPMYINMILDLKKRIEELESALNNAKKAKNNKK